MLDRLLSSTSQIKQQLILLGYALPPVVVIHNNKLRQVKEDYGQMSMLLLGKRHNTLYEDAQSVMEHITAEHFMVNNLNDLLLNSARVLSKLNRY